MVGVSADPAVRQFGIGDAGVRAVGFVCGSVAERAAKQHIAGVELVADDVCGQPGGEGAAQAQDAEVAVLGIGLDEELAMVGVEGWLQFEQGAGDRERSDGGVEVVDAQFGQFAPPGSGFDSGVQLQPPLFVWQGGA
jgi:hypothetical protein